MLKILWFVLNGVAHKHTTDHNNQLLYHHRDICISWLFAWITLLLIDLFVSQLLEEQNMCVFVCIYMIYSWQFIVYWFNHFWLNHNLYESHKKRLLYYLFIFLLHLIFYWKFMDGKVCSFLKFYLLYCSFLVSLFRL